jgi:hypothetical protein
MGTQGHWLDEWISTVPVPTEAVSEIRNWFWDQHLRTPESVAWVQQQHFPPQWVLGWVLPLVRAVSALAPPTVAPVADTGRLAKRPRDDDGLPVEEIEQDYHDEDAMFADSPLIEIIDDFASDQDVLLREGRENHEVEEEEDESEEDCYEDDYDDDDDRSSDLGHSLLPRRRRTFAEREYWRKERRWEKFLHILYATDKILMSMKPSPAAASGGSSNVSSSSPTVATVTADASTTAPSSTASPVATSAPPAARFHPVHAFIRCMTNPNLGLEICRPYGVWSILRAMGQRIPAEFTAKDESDGDRTAFQTLAESPATDCRLCIEEIRDVVECLMDADYRSAHLPRKSDGRLIVHVALENGWPCRDILSRKTSATCA